MTQEGEHQQSRCPKCRADRGEPCVTTDGREAERVHYGRPYWSSKVGIPAYLRNAPAKLNESEMEKRDRAEIERVLYLAESQERQLTHIDDLRIRMPSLSRHCSDTEMLSWGRSLARAGDDD